MHQLGDLAGPRERVGRTTKNPSPCPESRHDIFVSCDKKVTELFDNNC